MGYTLAILPELDDLTVGGLVAGCGIEVLKCLLKYLVTTISTTSRWAGSTLAAASRY
jgi:uncharacterized BrkB/YihY/UPF0761 family membrane protein